MTNNLDIPLGVIPQMKLDKYAVDRAGMEYILNSCHQVIPRNGFSIPGMEAAILAYIKFSNDKNLSEDELEEKYRVDRMTAEGN